MFTINHFIWLAIAIMLNVFLLTLTRRKHLSLKTNLTIMTVVMFFSESSKILNTISYYEDFGGYYLSPQSLPFHLCSIQIFFFFYLRFICKNEEIKNKLLCFMYPTLLLGGLSALLIPTAGVSFTEIGPYQNFGYHSFIVWFSIYLVREKIITIDFKCIKSNILYLLALMVIDLWINSALCAYSTNFMFLAAPPMENLPFLNMDHGYIVYLIHLATVALSSMVLVQLPFALKNRKLLKTGDTI